MAHNTLNDAQIERLAHKRAGEKIGWVIHALVYLLVNTLLVALAVWQGRHWAALPVLGWGLGLAIHGAVVWFAGAGSALRTGMVERERQRLALQRDPW